MDKKIDGILENVLTKKIQHVVMITLKIINIEGIGPTYAKKLESIEIKTSNDLLKKRRPHKDEKNYLIKRKYLKI